MNTLATRTLSFHLDLHACQLHRPGGVPTS